MSPFRLMVGVVVVTGAGMEWSTGVGVAVNIGVTMIEIYNIFIQVWCLLTPWLTPWATTTSRAVGAACAWQGTAGEITFLGGGTFVAIGSPNIEWANIISENGAVRPTTRRRCWWWWCEQSPFLGVGCGDGDVGALSPDAIRRHGTEAFPG